MMPYNQIRAAVYRLMSKTYLLILRVIVALNSPMNLDDNNLCAVIFYLLCRLGQIPLCGIIQIVQSYKSDLYALYIDNPCI